MRDIFESTTSYENWMRKETDVVESHLRHKHAAMKEDLFLFLKGTFFRWMELWAEFAPDSAKKAPVVLAVGDLHVDSFGTWRDREGRLVWGIDDFDEAYPLPYTNDLVRLAASVKIAIDLGALKLRLRDACEIIVQEYRKGLRSGGLPITLAEREQHLERLGVEAITPIQHFWRDLNHLPVTKEPLPSAARKALQNSLPDHIACKIARRMAGTGSLGQPRFVAIGEWNGAYIAREAKAMVPSACVWLNGSFRREIYSEQILKNAVRSHDPFQAVQNGWLIRRLSPDSNPIEIFDWPKKREEALLLGSMGGELANVHVGSRRAVGEILSHLDRQSSGWLKAAAKKIAKAVEADWNTYRHS